MKRLFIITLLFFLCLGTACQNDTQPINSEVSASQAAVGVWTNSEPLNTLVQMMVGWNKFVFNEDGTFAHYRASPTDDNWGEPENGNWKAFSSKYLNTGERYYGIVWDEFRPLIFVDAHTLEYKDTDGSLLATLRKGDHFPFSD